MNTSTKPATKDEYVTWAKKELSIEWLAFRNQRYYEAVSEEMRRQFESGPIWEGFLEQLEEVSSQYLLDTQYQLLPPKPIPSFVTKPYASVIDKSYRKNIINNPNWPDPPTGDWIKPDNCYQKFNDIVRSTIVVRYLDGVEIIANVLKDICDSNKAQVDISMEARDNGYYACHCGVSQTFETSTPSWDTMTFTGCVELQITTQVQEVLRQLTHKYYEDRRISVAVTSKKWQWDYRGQDFTANYLGHILHYVEGMILELRDKRR